MLGCCGIDCSKCETYLATQADDDEMRGAVASKWSQMYEADIKPEQINCDGCGKEGRKFIYCEQMCEVRRCCMEEMRENCAGCESYACGKLEKIFKVAPEARENLEKLGN